jgi:hypothetical protein
MPPSTVSSAPRNPHLDHAGLVETCEEAHRVTRSGRQVVLHDFEPDSAVSRWFSEVVHRYSRKGHEYQHCGSVILTNALNDAGFENITSRPLFDPIIARVPHRRRRNWL